VATEQWIAVNSEVAEKFLRSLAQADDFAVRNPAKAQVIVQERLGLNPASMPAVWARNQFSLSLDQSLLAAMEDEARWMIRSNLTTERQVPVLLDYIVEDTMEEIRPEAVDIIR
jgi:NitT/TauT family transport system substrate-binding protein